MHKHPTPLISQFFWLPGTPDFFGPHGAVWQSSSASRFTAGASGFLNLSQPGRGWSPALFAGGCLPAPSPVAALKSPALVG
jgi:hypothetical protein